MSMMLAAAADFFSSLDTGIDASSLYIRPGSTAKPLDTSAVPGQPNNSALSDLVLSSSLKKDLKEVSVSTEDSTSTKQPPTPLPWHHLPQPELTPQVLRELKAIQLRGHASSKSIRYGEDSDMQRLPTHFAFAVEVNEGTSPVAGGGKESQAAGVPNYRSRRGKSLLQDLIGDADVKRFTSKKYRKLQEKNTSGGKRWFSKMKAKRRLV